MLSHHSGIAYECFVLLSPASHACTGDQRALDTAMALPALVLQALAHALDYLKAFNLETVLRVGAAFQPLQSVHEMSLSPNTLWCVVDAQTCKHEVQCVYSTMHHQGMGPWPGWSYPVPESVSLEPFQGR